MRVMVSARMVVLDAIELGFAAELSELAPFIGSPCFSRVADAALFGPHLRLLEIYFHPFFRNVLLAGSFHSKLMWCMPSFSRILSGAPNRLNALEHPNLQT